MKKNKSLWSALRWALLAGLLLPPVGPVVVLAQEPSAAAVARRAFDEQDWQRLHDALDYSEKPRSEKRARRTTGEQDKKETPAGASAWPQLILLGMVVAGLGWFLWQTYGGPAGRRAPRTPAANDDDDDGLDTLAHNLLEMEIDPLLAQAEARGAWHLATRLRFLSLLQTMHAGGRIRWQKNKTNRDYALETVAWAGGAEFRRLALAYERIWYGLHYPDEATYRGLAADFSTLALAAGAAQSPA